MLDQSGKYIVFDTLLKFKQKVNLKDDKVLLFIKKTEEQDIPIPYRYQIRTLILPHFFTFVFKQFLFDSKSSIVEIPWTWTLSP